MATAPSYEYDPAAKTLTLRCKQTVEPGPGCSEPKPMLIPIAVGLVGPDGNDFPLSTVACDGGGFEAVSTVPGGSATTAILRLTQQEQTFVFGGIPDQPVPSVLRYAHFSNALLRCA